MGNPHASSLKGLRNLWQTSQQMLQTAGIFSTYQLRAMGSAAAFFAVQKSGYASKPSLNLLCALEGALTGRDWKEIANDSHIKLTLLMQLDDLKKWNPVSEAQNLAR